MADNNIINLEWRRVLDMPQRNEAEGKLKAVAVLAMAERLDLERVVFHAADFHPQGII
jgi:hypothetical protein